MKKSKKLKRASVTLAVVSSHDAKPYDRRATDLLRNAMVAPIVVDDPIERGGKLTVLRSLRDDPLAAMHNAGQLDDAQFLAGRHWQRNRDIAQLGGIRAIDPAKEAVDGGKIAESSVTDAQIVAFKEMAKAISDLGLEGNGLIKMFLDEGLTLRQISYRWGAVTERDRRYVGMRLREALDTLAVTFGYARNKLHKEPQDDVVAS